MAGECGFRDDPAPPHDVDQIILGDYASTAAHQMYQQVEHLRPDRDRDRSARKFPPTRVKDMLSEGNLHAGAPVRGRTCRNPVTYWNTGII
jgi:hypothetical protein